MTLQTSSAILNAVASPLAERTMRVMLSCTGVGVFDRGIETFFREAFDGLRNLDGVEMRLVKGGGLPAPDESVAWALPRTGRLAPLVGKLVGRDGYVVEQWSSFLSVVSEIRRFRPDVVFYSDANLGFLLHRFRRRIGVPFRLLFSNGGPCHPPFDRTDFVHQVTPPYYDEALEAGESRDKHLLVPYGIAVPSRPPVVDPVGQRELRARLGVPQDRPVVLSVGWISASQKRMDYVVREVAALPAPRPFLQLLGAMDQSSRDIEDLAKNLLGRDGFAAKAVSYADVFDYYRAADCFVLASLSEGFGRAYLEALMHGLPTIAHRSSVTEFVMGQEGSLGDLRSPGALAELMASGLRIPLTDEAARRRWQHVRDRFSWSTLRPLYRAMFFHCAGQALP